MEYTGGRDAYRINYGLQRPKCLLNFMSGFFFLGYFIGFLLFFLLEMNGWDFFLYILVFRVDLLGCGTDLLEGFLQ